MHPWGSGLQTSDVVTSLHVEQTYVSMVYIQAGLRSRTSVLAGPSMHCMV